MSFSFIALVSALVYVVVNFLRNVQNKKWTAVLTQATAWAAGVVGIVLAAHTSWASSVSFNGVALDKVGIGSQVFLGLSFSSIAGTGQNVLSTLGASYPSLFPTLAKKEAGAPSSPPSVASRKR